MPVTIREGFKKIKKFFHTDGGRGVSKLVIFPNFFFNPSLKPGHCTCMGRDTASPSSQEEVMTVLVKVYSVVM